MEIVKWNVKTSHEVEWPLCLHMNTLLNSQTQVIKRFLASWLSRSMDWEAPCVSVHSASVGLHLVLGHAACFWLWKLRTRTLWDQLHHQLVISDLHCETNVSDLYFSCICRQTSHNQSACISISRWRMSSSLNDRIYIFLILVLCFGFPTLTIVASYLAILLTVRTTAVSWHKGLSGSCVCIL